MRLQVSYSFRPFAGLDGWLRRGKGIPQCRAGANAVPLRMVAMFEPASFAEVFLTYCILDQTNRTLLKTITEGEGGGGGLDDWLELI